jgi:hypothetical protein
VSRITPGRAKFDTFPPYSIDVRNQLVNRGWCSSVGSRLASIDVDEFEHMEKTLHAMVLLHDFCQSDFVPLLPVFDKLNGIVAAKNRDQDSTYTDIHKNIQILVTHLRQITSSADDL